MADAVGAAGVVGSEGASATFAAPIDEEEEVRLVWPLLVPEAVAVGFLIPLTLNAKKQRFKTSETAEKQRQTLLTCW